MDTEKTAVEIEWIEVIMQIFVDADACPVVGIVESLAENIIFRQHCFVIRTMCYIQIIAM